MTRKFLGWLVLTTLTALTACGGGGGDSGTPPFGGGNDGETGISLSIALSTSTVTAAAPATVTVKVLDLTKKAVAGAVVDFTVTNGLGVLSAASALTDADGVAQVSLSPSDAAKTGADTVVATSTVSAGTSTASVGFQLSATTAEFTSLSAAAGVGDQATSPVGPYGQTVITGVMSGVSDGAPAVLTINSACATLGKATLSPTTLTITSGTFAVAYSDNGCGALQVSDTVTASLSGSSKQIQGTVFLSAPSANSLTFVSATPSTIYLKGSGLTESSTVLFQLNDTAGHALPGQQVRLQLTTYTGGLTIDGGSSTVTKTTDALGQVDVKINSGTVPTPVRVSATLVNGGVTTVSNALAVGVGLPSQLNFSLSQKTINIECFNVDGVSNNYVVYAADRSGNPVPNGTALTFWAEGGQVQTSVQTALDVNGIARANANFVCQEPRPADGRVTVVGYAIGEESFVDLNGNNQYDAGEPFQDLGDIVKDKLFDNVFDPTFDEYVSLAGIAAGTLSCNTSFDAAYPLLVLDAGSPVRPETCDQKWTQRTYVRRAVETVMSTSEAGLLWGSTNGLSHDDCHVRSLQAGSSPTRTTYYALGGGDTWYGGPGLLGSLPLIVADANPVRLNPMPAGTVITAGDASTGLTVKVAGTPVANTANAPGAAVLYEFAAGTSAGQFTLTTQSPGGLRTSYGVQIIAGNRPSVCP